MNLAFILHRFVWMLVVVWALTVVTFVLWYLVPGDPARIIAGDEASPEHVERLRKELGLDQPIYVQYLRHTERLVQFDLGTSHRTGRSVVDDISTYLPATIELAFIATFFYVLLSVPLGVIAAVHREGVFDYAIRIASMIGVGMPAFWLAMILQLVFYQELGWLPAGSRFPLDLERPSSVTGLLTIDSLLTGDFQTLTTATRFLALPVAACVCSRIAVGVKITRAIMLDVLKQDYMRTARSKGLRERRVVYVHGLRNALIPVVTALSLQFGSLLTGTVVVETVFAWPGLGRYAVTSIASLDIPSMLGVVIVFALIYVLVNFLVDVLYLALDPRIRFT